MERIRAKKETKGSWTSLCRLYTQELAKESGASAKARTGTRRVAKVARDGGKNSWQKGSGKKGGKGQEVMDGVKSSKEGEVRNVVMGGVKTGEVGKLQN